MVVVVCSSLQIMRWNNSASPLINISNCSTNSPLLSSNFLLSPTKSTPTGKNDPTPLTTLSQNSTENEFAIIVLSSLMTFSLNTFFKNSSISACWVWGGSCIPGGMRFRNFSNNSRVDWRRCSFILLVRLA